MTSAFGSYITALAIQVLVVHTLHGGCALHVAVPDVERLQLHGHLRETGSALTEHLVRSRRTADVLAEQAPVGAVRIPTDGRDVVDVAADVIAASGRNPRAR